MTLDSSGATTAQIYLNDATVGTPAGKFGPRTALLCSCGK